MLAIIFSTRTAISWNFRHPFSDERNTWCSIYVTYAIMITPYNNCRVIVFVKFSHSGSLHLHSAPMKSKLFRSTQYINHCQSFRLCLTITFFKYTNFNSTRQVSKLDKLQPRSSQQVQCVVSVDTLYSLHFFRPISQNFSNFDKLTFVYFIKGVLIRAQYFKVR